MADEAPDPTEYITFSPDETKFFCQHGILKDDNTFDRAKAKLLATELHPDKIDVRNDAREARGEPRLQLTSPEEVKLTVYFGKLGDILRHPQWPHDLDCQELKSGPEPTTGPQPAAKPEFNRPEPQPAAKPKEFKFGPSAKPAEFERPAPRSKDQIISEIDAILQSKDHWYRFFEFATKLDQIKTLAPEEKFAAFLGASHRFFNFPRNPSEPWEWEAMFDTLKVRVEYIATRYFDGRFPKLEEKIQGDYIQAVRGSLDALEQLDLPWHANNKRLQEHFLPNYQNYPPVIEKARSMIKPEINKAEVSEMSLRAKRIDQSLDAIASSKVGFNVFINELERFKTELEDKNYNLRQRERDDAYKKQLSNMRMFMGVPVEIQSTPIKWEQSVQALNRRLATVHRLTKDYAAVWLNISKEYIMTMGDLLTPLNEFPLDVRNRLIEKYYIEEIGSNKNLGPGLELKNSLLVAARERMTENVGTGTDSASLASDLKITKRKAENQQPDETPATRLSAAKGQIQPKKPRSEATAQELHDKMNSIIESDDPLWNQFDEYVGLLKKLKSADEKPQRMYHKSLFELNEFFTFPPIHTSLDSTGWISLVEELNRRLASLGEFVPKDSPNSWSLIQDRYASVIMETMKSVFDKDKLATAIKELLIEFINPMADNNKIAELIAISNEIVRQKSQRKSTEEQQQRTTVTEEGKLTSAQKTDERNEKKEAERLAERQARFRKKREKNQPKATESKTQSASSSKDQTMVKYEESDSDSEEGAVTEVKKEVKDVPVQVPEDTNEEVKSDSDSDSEVNFVESDSDSEEVTEGKRSSSVRVSSWTKEPVSEKGKSTPQEKPTQRVDTGEKNQSNAPESSSGSTQIDSLPTSSAGMDTKSDLTPPSSSRPSSSNKSSAAGSSVPVPLPEKKNGGPVPDKVKQDLLQNLEKVDKNDRRGVDGAYDAIESMVLNVELDCTKMTDAFPNFYQFISSVERILHEKEMETERMQFIALCKVVFTDAIKLKVPQCGDDARAIVQGIEDKIPEFDKFDFKVILQQATQKMKVGQPMSAAATKQEDKTQTSNASSSPGETVAPTKSGSKGQSPPVSSSRAATKNIVEYPANLSGRQVDTRPVESKTSSTEQSNAPESKSSSSSNDQEMVAVAGTSAPVGEEEDPKSGQAKKSRMQVKQTGKAPENKTTQRVDKRTVEQSTARQSSLQKRRSAAESRQVSTDAKDKLIEKLKNAKTKKDRDSAIDATWQLIDNVKWNEKKCPDWAKSFGEFYSFIEKVQQVLFDKKPVYSATDRFDFIAGCKHLAQRIMDMIALDCSDATQIIETIMKNLPKDDPFNLSLDILRKDGLEKKGDKWMVGIEELHRRVNNIIAIKKNGPSDDLLLQYIELLESFLNVAEADRPSNFGEKVTLHIIKPIDLLYPKKYGNRVKKRLDEVYTMAKSIVEQAKEREEQKKKSEKKQAKSSAKTVPPPESKAVNPSSQKAATPSPVSVPLSEKKNGAPSQDADMLPVSSSSQAGQVSEQTSKNNQPVATAPSRLKSQNSSTSVDSNKSSAAEPQQVSTDAKDELIQNLRNAKTKKDRDSAIGATRQLIDAVKWNENTCPGWADSFGRFYSFIQAVQQVLFDKQNYKYSDGDRFGFIAKCKRFAQDLMDKIARECDDATQIIDAIMENLPKDDPFNLRLDILRKDGLEKKGDKWMVGIEELHGRVNSIIARKKNGPSDDLLLQYKELLESFLNVAKADRPPNFGEKVALHIIGPIDVLYSENDGAKVYQKLDEVYTTAKSIVEREEQKKKSEKKQAQSSKAVNPSAAKSSASSQDADMSDETAPNPKLQTSKNKQPVANASNQDASGETVVPTENKQPVATESSQDADMSPVSSSSHAKREEQTVTSPTPGRPLVDESLETLTPNPNPGLLSANPVDVPTSPNSKTTGNNQKSKNKQPVATASSQDAKSSSSPGETVAPTKSGSTDFLAALNMVLQQNPNPSSWRDPRTLGASAPSTSAKTNQRETKRDVNMPKPPLSNASTNAQKEVEMSDAKTGAPPPDRIKLFSTELEKNAATLPSGQWEQWIKDVKTLAVKEQNRLRRLPKAPTEQVGGVWPLFHIDKVSAADFKKDEQIVLEIWVADFNQQKLEERFTREEKKVWDQRTRVGDKTGFRIYLIGTIEDRITDLPILEDPSIVYRIQPLKLVLKPNNKADEPKVSVLTKAIERLLLPLDRFMNVPIVYWLAVPLNLQYASLIMTDRRATPQSLADDLDSDVFETKTRLAEYSVIAVKLMQKQNRFTAKSKPQIEQSQVVVQQTQIPGTQPHVAVPPNYTIMAPIPRRRRAPQPRSRRRRVGYYVDEPFVSTF
jgi:hypothetical protein